MGLRLDKDKLTELMRDFYILTGIKIAVFDSSFTELLSYPPGHCEFCGLMHAGRETREHCTQSNRNSFISCRKSGELIVYHCHAGLVEATAPLKDNGVILGYIMFGQITDIYDRDKVESILASAAERYGISETPQKGSFRVKYRSPDQIRAAAKILDACTLYALKRDIITPEKEKFLNRLDAYIDSHIQENISAERLCVEFGIKRGKLYELAGRYLGTGLAAYIRKKRINISKELLTGTDYPIHKIASECGFIDYNYFCKVFKSEVGVTAKKYRTINSV